MTENSVKIKRKSPPSFTTEHKAKIGAYWKGRKRKSHKAWNKGKHHTEESKEKNRKAHLGKYHTLITKKKIGAAQIGDKNRFWKGGKMKEYPESEQIRKSIEYKFWRDSCFQRDNYTCQSDGKKGRLEVHHIFNFADFPKLRLSINNGITLCKFCHNEFHDIYGKNKNTNNQLEEFLTNKKNECQI